MWLKTFLFCSLFSRTFSDCSLYVNTLARCVCDESRCVRKCCGRNEILQQGICTESSIAGTVFEFGARYRNTETVRGCENLVEVNDTELLTDEFCLEESYDRYSSTFTLIKCPISIGPSKEDPVRKCCADSEVFINISCTHQDGTDVKLFKDAIRLRNNQRLVYSNLKCSKDRYKIKVDEFELLEDGALLWDDTVVLNVDSYCVDNFSTNGIDYRIGALLCVQEEEEARVEIHITGMIISMPFLLITFIVYLILPDKNLHRKALMFYVVSLLLGYIFLVTNQLTDYSFEDVPCHIFGYAIIFFFLVSFFWMNVMCIDMWLTFSGVRGFGWKRSSEKKRFMFYCLYALGVPVVHVFVVFLLNKYGDKKAIYHPLIGENKCFLEDGFPILFYFYLPMSVLIGINIVLFILTTIKIQRVKKETSMLKQHDSQRHAYENDRQRFNLYLKLLFAMGINWTMELISWAVLWKMQQRAPWIWYLTDLTNALYGVFIFAMFVFKKKIWQSLKKRYYVFRGKPHLAQTIITSSQMTRTSHMSASEGEYRMSDMRNGRGEERALRS